MHHAYRICRKWRSHDCIVDVPGNFMGAYVRMYVRSYVAPLIYNCTASFFIVYVRSLPSTRIYMKMLDVRSVNTAHI